MLQMEDLATPLTATFRCPICLGLLQDPVFAGGKPCQHVFCKDCIAPVLQGSGKCPTCRSKLTKKMLQPNLFIKAVLDEVLVLCPSRCGWKGRNDARKAHAESCPLRQLLEDLNQVSSQLQATKEEHADLQEQQAKLQQELALVEQACQAKQELRNELEKKLAAHEKEFAKFPEEARSKRASEGSQGPPAKKARSRQANAYANLPKAEQERNNAALLEAAEDAQWHDVESLLAEDLCDPRTRNHLGGTALHSVAKHGSKPMAERLLEAGADADAKRHDGKAPLHIAVRHGNTGVVEALVEASCSVVMTESINRDTALHIASVFGNKAIAKVLVTAGATVDAISDGTDTPMLRAARVGKKDVLQYLVQEAKCDVTARAYGKNALHEAALGGKREAFKFLVNEAGFDVTAKTDEGDTPLHLVLQCQRIVCIQDLSKMLLAKGASVNTKNSSGDTPLHMVIRHQRGTLRDTLCDYLVLKAADVKAANNAGITPLHEVAATSDVELAGLLVSKGAVMNAQAADGSYPLHQVLYERMAEFLLAKGAKLNQARSDGCTLLHLAAANWNPGLVEYLVTKVKADANIVNKKGETPLAMACTGPYAVRLDPGARVNMKAEIKLLLRAAV